MNSIPSTAQRFWVLKAFSKERKTDREFQSSDFLKYVTCLERHGKCKEFDR